MMKRTVIFSSFAFLCLLVLLSVMYSTSPKAVFDMNLSQGSRYPEMARETKQEEQCEPDLSIVYLKIHKTGSTTLIKILNAHVRRYQKPTPGISQRVSVLPGPYYGGFPGRFKKRFACYHGSLICGPKAIRGTAQRPVKVLMGHLRFDADEIRTVVDSKAKYVTMLREPYAQFESSFNYYYAQYKKFPSWIAKAACHPEPYLQITKKYGVAYSEYLKMAKTSLNQSLAWYFRSTNVQSYELGLEPFKDDENYILAKAHEIDAIFDLVAIMEYYVESIVLLKDILCMSWEDAALLHSHANTGSYKKHNLTVTEKEIVRTLNKQDLIVYDYFNKSFWRQVDEYGRSRMERESAELLRHVALLQKQQTSTSKKRVPQKSEHDPKRPEKVRSRRSNGNYTNFPVRDRWIDKLVEGMKPRNDLDTNLVRELAAYMYDNQGWCTS